MNASTFRTESYSSLERIDVNKIHHTDLAIEIEMPVIHKSKRIAIKFWNVPELWIYDGRS